jgi:hypothetical protein
MYRIGGFSLKYTIEGSVSENRWWRSGVQGYGLPVQKIHEKARNLIDCIHWKDPLTREIRRSL